MPTPDQIARNHRPPLDIDEMFRRMPETKDSLASEIAKLRDEIAALRAELAPVPSLIVTGRQALDEFKRLAHAGPQRPEFSRAAGVGWNERLELNTKTEG